MNNAFTARYPQRETRKALPDLPYQQKGMAGKIHVPVKPYSIYYHTYHTYIYKLYYIDYRL